MFLCFVVSVDNQCRSLYKKINYYTVQPVVGAPEGLKYYKI